MEIKTIEEILKTKPTYHNMYEESDVIEMLKYQAEQFLDYASENVEVDYNIIKHNLTIEGDTYIIPDTVEVYIKQGEFNKIKRLIK